ncbi:MAG: hypothetical protein LR015_03545 [Verrucomicrobia bacterium]|nr:hypothetical protein [Verrucomicrobiota bacterium]
MKAPKPDSRQISVFSQDNCLYLELDLEDGRDWDGLWAVEQQVELCWVEDEVRYGEP